MEGKFEIPTCETCESRHKSLFKDLNVEEQESLSGTKGCNFYKKKQTIFFEGTRPTGLYCLNSGKVKVYKIGDEGREQIVRLAKPGDILGYRALVGGELYSATAEALEDACVCVIPKNIFIDLLNDNQTLSMNFMQLLSQDLKSAEDNITNIAQKPVRERLAQSILMLKETYGFEEDDNTIDISLTREDLANIVGTATETVIRLLSEFKKEELIELNGRKIKVLNFDELIHTANMYD